MHGMTMMNVGRGQGHGTGWRLLAVLALPLIAGGCANFSPDGGMFTVQAMASEDLGKDVVKIRSEADAAIVEARVKALLAKPLSASSAVQVALLNNRGLQAAYNELGISEAQMVEASLPPPPTIALARLVWSGGYEIERQILQNVLGLLTLPRRREIAEARFRQAQIRAVETTLRTAAEARRAYYRSVAANEVAKALENARLSAEAIADLSKQLGETGALSRLDQARQNVLYAEVSGHLATARLRQRTEREGLVRALGLWGEQTKFRLPDSLPPLPKSPRAMATVESDAVGRRVDLVIAQMELDILASELGLTKRTRLIDALEVAGHSKKEKEETVDHGKTEAEITRKRGVEVEFQIPIYDFGEARVVRAEETYMQAVNRLLERAVNVRSEARQAYQTYRGAYDIARHHEREILPLRQIISDEALLSYNAMITDVFELLADVRARIGSNVQAIEARREFWLATVDLSTAILGGRGGGETGTAPQTAMAGGTGEAAGH